MTGTISPSRNTVMIGQHLRQLARQAGDGENADRQRQPAQHLHHAEVVIDLGLRPRACRRR